MTTMLSCAVAATAHTVSVAAQTDVSATNIVTAKSHTEGSIAHMRPFEPTIASLEKCKDLLK